MSSMSERHWVLFISKKRGAETLQLGLEFDNFKPRLMSCIVKCVPWLNESRFGVMIGVFWKRESRPVERHQCRPLRCQLYFSLHIHSLWCLPMKFFYKESIIVANMSNVLDANRHLALLPWCNSMIIVLSYLSNSKFFFFFLYDSTKKILLILPPPPPLPPPFFLVQAPPRFCPRPLNADDRQNHVACNHGREGLGGEAGDATDESPLSYLTHVEETKQTTTGFPNSFT